MQKERVTIELFGLAAHAVYEAEKASFYGINGDNPWAYEAYRRANKAIRKYLHNNPADHWVAYQIIEAHSMPTDGTQRPYWATVTFDIESLETA